MNVHADDISWDIHRIECSYICWLAVERVIIIGFLDSMNVDADEKF